MTDVSLTPAARRWYRVLWISLLLAYGVMFVAFLPRVGAYEDHDQHLVFHELQCWNQELFGLEKQWAPVMFGGISLAGDPQTPVLSPAVMAGYATDPFYGMRIVTILWFMVGALGTWLFAGLWVRDRETRWMASALFVANGFFVCHLAYGHVTFMPFQIFPLLLWALHRSASWTDGATGVVRAGRRLLVTLVLGAGLALAVDGSALVILHPLLWVGVYALVLAVVRRSPAPVLHLLGAAVVAAFADAAFLWPMVDAASMFPRDVETSFTNPLALLIFMVVPFRGGIPWLRTYGNGYELSVFVGVVLVWVILRHGRAALRAIPRDVRIPLLVTSIVAAWLGMGSLAELGVPKFASPFDLLRELPGFRSLRVTGRYWGFLALPLALVGAVALRRFLAVPRSRHRLAVWMVAAILFPLAFQTATITDKLLPGRIYEPVDTSGLYETAQGERIEYVMRDEGRFMGAHMTPVVGVIDAYYGHEFVRPSMATGTRLVQHARVVGEETEWAEVPSGTFTTWSSIRLAPLPAGTVPPDAQVRLTLNQAWHPYWTASPGRVERHAKGNLEVVVAGGDLEAGPVTITFHDAVSALGVAVSKVAWPVLLALIAVLWVVLRNRPRDRDGVRG